MILKDTPVASSGEPMVVGFVFYVNGCHDQSSTKVLNCQPVILCSILLHRRFMGNSRKEMLHGEHREDGTVGTKWTLIDVTPLLDCVYTIQHIISYFVLQLTRFFGFVYDH